jgi:hypothetical protein
MKTQILLAGTALHPQRQRKKPIPKNDPVQTFLNAQFVPI